MKTPFLSISCVFFIIIVLILLGSHFQENEPSSKPCFMELRQKNDSSQNLNFFEKKEEESKYELTYGWRDFKNNTHYLTFSISKQQLSDSEQEYGYYPEEMKKYVDEHIEKMKEKMIIYLNELANREIAKSKYSQYITVKDITLKSFNLKVSASPARIEKARAEFKRITHKLSKEQNAYFRKIEKEQKKISKQFLEERGLRFIGKKIGVDYARCVKNNRSRVKHIVESMRKIKRDLNLYQFLELMLTFIQEIKFGIPSFKENDKIILGFWVPFKVLVNNLGDCDSKGVTFAAMWMNFRKYPLLLFEVPEHLFVGIAIPSFRGEGVTIRGLRYTLLEVTGPKKMPPGLITPYSQFYLEGGHFHYVFVQ